MTGARGGDESLPREILEHYEAVDESRRLESDTGPLEAARTRAIAERHLPPPPAVVVDVGGAAGAYAFWLAARGYDVHLLDPVEKHVAEARRVERETGTRLAGIAVGEARSLPWSDECADAALLFGPLYHLPRREERVAALAEARRVLKPGGVLLAAAISRFASILDGLRRDVLGEPEFAAMVERDLAEGQHRNATDKPEYFTTSYFHRPEELAREMADASLEYVETAGVEGPAWLLPDLEARCADGAARGRLLAALARVETEPALLGASAHLVAVARKR